MLIPRGSWECRTREDQGKLIAKISEMDIIQEESKEQRKLMTDKTMGRFAYKGQVRWQKAEERSEHS